MHMRALRFLLISTLFGFAAVYELFEWAVTDHHACRMGRGVAVEAFELQRQIDQPLNIALAFIGAAQFGHQQHAAARTVAVCG